MDNSNWVQEEDWEKWTERAREEAEKSPCLRMKFGAIIVNEGKEVSKGVNKPVYEDDYCKICMREEASIPPRTRAEYCKALHAEQWAVINALKKGEDIEGAVLVVTGFNPNSRENVVYNRFSCTLCVRTMVPTGLAGVVTVTPEGAKYKPMRQVYEEAYSVLRDVDRERIMTEDALQAHLRKK